MTRAPRKLVEEKVAVLIPRIETPNSSRALGKALVTMMETFLWSPFVESCGLDPRFILIFPFLVKLETSQILK